MPCARRRRRRRRQKITSDGIHSGNDDDLGSSDPDELLDTSDSTSRQLGKQEHAGNVVVLEQVGRDTHFFNLCCTVSALCLRLLSVHLARSI